MKEFAHSIRPAAAVLTIGLLSCGGDLTLPNATAAGLTLTVVQGNAQNGTVGQALPDPVVVLVVSADVGTPISGRKVAFVASGSDAQGFQPDTAVTDSQGHAVTRWMLGTTVGPYNAEARIVAQGDSVVPVVLLQAAAKADAPDTVRAVGPTNQPGRRNQELADPLVVMAVDRFGNPVDSAEVEWKTDGGNGETSQETSRTTADGTTSVTWTLGERIGVQKAEAKLGGATGSPVTFTATVLF